MPQLRDIGRMRHQVTIQSSTTAIDANGQPIRTWTDLQDNVPADVNTVTGGESFRGRQVDATATHVVTTRWLSTVTPEMRVQYDPEGDSEVVLHILSVRNIDGRHRYMDLMCKEDR